MTNLEASTQDEDVINSIIRATNRQTEVTDEQFLAFTDFSKKLEAFFQAFPKEKSLFYERRTRQFASVLSIDKTRIISPGNVIRSFAAMFLEEPHRTTRNYSALRAKVGAEIFGKDHRLEPYYVAAFALYRLETMFKTAGLDPKYKVTRYHLLLAMRILGNPGSLPKYFNSNEMERYCGVLRNILWDDKVSENLVERSIEVINAAANDEFHRDNIRIEGFTNKVKDEIVRVAANN
jgi:AIPR protein